MRFAVVVSLTCRVEDRAHVLHDLLRLVDCVRRVELLQASRGRRAWILGMRWHCTMHLSAHIHHLATSKRALNRAVPQKDKKTTEVKRCRGFAGFTLVPGTSAMQPETKTWFPDLIACE